MGEGEGEASTAADNKERELRGEEEDDDDDDGGDGGEEYNPENEALSLEEEEEGEEEEGEEEGGEEEEEEEEDRAMGERPETCTFPSKNGKLTWSSTAHGRRGATDEQSRPGPPTPGPTEEAASRATDIASTFRLFVTPAIEDIVLEMTNLEGRRRYGDDWKGMDRVDLRAYVGLLILAGVYRSRGEAAASLWDAESGRAIFRATMPLKDFHAYSTLLRFDNRETRRERRASDKLAAVRDVWDAWVLRLPLLYNPGPEVTVDEQLVPFRGRCPFRQYMPSKPAKYGIKTWVACDARSSYAWKMQGYTGKPTTGGGPERNLGMRVVLDVTEGLAGRNVTCDNYFTSYELARRLLARGITVVGTVRKNKPELPPALLATRDRAVFSSMFAFTPTTALVSYVPKKNRNVVLMSTRHAEAEVGDRPDGKPAIILDYNRNKGGVDNLDKVIGTYSCRRMTARWPLVVFHNVVDVSAYNAFVIWREVRPDWMSGKRSKRRFFLERLGKELVTPLVERRACLPRTEASAAVVRAARRARGRAEAAPEAEREPETRAAAVASALSRVASKRKRCQICPSKKDSKTHTVCCTCRRYICWGCSRAFCPACADRRVSSDGGGGRGDDDGGAARTCDYWRTRGRQGVEGGDG
ncbi:piggyBac transposable element-derived protein 4-like isoform X2 [Pungitius pungitius]